MFKSIFTPATDPQIKSLSISEELKSLANCIKNHGTKGASTLTLQAEHYGNISRAIKKLESSGVIIRTEKRNTIDKRGNLRRRVAHRIYIGIDATLTGS